MDALFATGGVLFIFLIVALLIVFFYFIPLGLWVSAITAGVRVRLTELIGMRLRKVPPSAIIAPLITARKAGIDVSASQLETHFLARGNVRNTVQALISADKANIDLPFQQATAIDLAGRDVFEAVQVSVNPKVIETPPISAIAKDGIQVRAIARVTVRANINQLVGGAGEETIIARVGEGIVSTIGSSGTHLMVLENPDNISKTVLAKGLDSGTAFEILSIDIADVDVGENIGAKLQTDQAEADLQVARAKAEERRAAAVAAEQEQRAAVQEQRARLVAAEAEIPQAMAEAFRTGNLGVMDYYNLRNVEADTQMRRSIGGDEDPAAGS
ncbi:MAG: flotillin-like protein FloA [Bacteroidota bacterium]